MIHLRFAALRPWVAALIVTLGVGAGCTRGAAAPSDPHALVASGARLVDVRTREEFAAGHIAGAVNIPVDELATRLGELGARDHDVVVYCASGMRSASAARLLARAGFTSVHDLGPMSAW
jgi:phage shock protein E